MGTETTGPKFLTERWAACSNVECDRFGRHYLVPQPITKQPCRGCRIPTFRTPAWSGWDDAKRMRARFRELPGT